MSQRRSGFDRVEGEKYDTPAWVTQLIVPYLKQFKVRAVWEPCAGNGKMVRALKKAGFETYGTTRDFLKQDRFPARSVNTICTNPPYGHGGKLAEAIIEHALHWPDADIVAMLLRVDFDSGSTRTRFFRDNRRWAMKIVLLDRIEWFPSETGAGPSTNHAWYIWSRGYNAHAEIRYAGIG